ncbi:MAG: hypothetical protein K2Y23_12685 [Cyanobacteria bacterium]|nr:hypothetical protein [Cyanobacteriota bacterium]
METPQTPIEHRIATSIARRIAKGIAIAIAAIIGISIFIFLGGTIVQWLWNWLMPPLFGWRELTFWQALGMLALCRILFGGVGGRGHRRGKWHNDNWTPEEKAQFKAKIKSRWGIAPKNTGSPPASTTGPASP